MTSLAGKLLSSLHLPADTVHAERWLRVNDKIVIYDAETAALGAGNLLIDSSRYTKPESGYYVNSLHVDRSHDGTYRLSSDTIVDGETEKNFSCIVRANGQVVSGKVNTFAFGEMPIDQGYLDELLEDSEVADHPWDVVQRAAAVEPTKGRSPQAAAGATTKVAEKAKTDTGEPPQAAVAAAKVAEKDKTGEQEKMAKKKRAQPDGLAPAEKTAKKLRSKKKAQSELKAEE